MNILNVLLYGGAIVIIIITLFLSVINIRLLGGTLIAGFIVWLIAGLVCASLGVDMVFWIKVIGAICLFAPMLVYDGVVLSYLKNGGSESLEI